MRAQRFYTADAMRGIAAMFVVYYHSRMVMAPGAWSPRFAYLAVDLFFCLSGFVLAHAYDSRFAAGLTVSSFMQSRAIRLLPLFWVGLVLGLIAAVATGHGVDPVAFMANAVLLPSLAHREKYLFPLNPPGWSLFFEVWVANFFYAAAWKLLNGRLLWFVIAASAAALLATEKAYYRLDVGSTWDTIASGFARVLFSFFLGVAVARIRTWRAPPVRLASTAILTALVGCLCAPLAGHAAHIFEFGCIALIFPVLIYLSSSTFESRPEIGGALGDMSYAAYAIHAPIVVIAAATFPAASPTIWFGVVFTVLIGVASGVLDRADRPIRSIITSFVRQYSKASTTTRRLDRECTNPQKKRNRNTD